MKRTLFFLMVFLIAAVISSAGGAGEEEAAPGEDFVFGEDPLSFSWYVNNNAFVARDFAVDYAAEVWVKENLNVEIEMIDAGGAAEQKFTTILASGDFPDVMTVFPSQLPELVDNQIVVPLDAYLPGSYFLDAYGEGLIELQRSSDGNLYQYRDWMIAGEQGNGNGGWMVQKAVWEGLGSPTLETYEDLYDFLNAVADRYPDMIPLGLTNNLAGMGPIFAGFKEGAFVTSVQGLYAEPVGNELISIFESETFRETVLYTSRLFREGLLDPDVFALTRDQSDERLPNTAVVVSNNIARPGRVTRDALIAENSNNDWMPIWPIHKDGLDPNEIYPNTFNRLGWTSNVITAEADAPAAIFEYLDWAAAPYGNLIYWFGPPGLFWSPDEGFTEEGYPNDMFPEYFTASADEQRFAQGFGRIGNTSFVDGMARYFNEINPEYTNWTKRTQINYAWQVSQDATQFADTQPAGNTPEGIIFQEIGDIYDVAFSRMIFAASDAEVLQILERASAEARAAGMDDLLDYKEEAWRRNRQLLGQ